MADLVYTVNQDLPENIEGFEQFSEEDKALVASFQINNTFDPAKNFLELHILSLSDELLESNYSYTGYKQLGNAKSAGRDGASVLTLDPISDSRLYGYENGGVKLLYHFLDDLYTSDNSSVDFYIQDISQDRTEVSLSNLSIAPEDLVTITSAIRDNIQNQSYFTGFRLNFKNNDLLIATNIDTLDVNGESVVVVKLYEPLPTTYKIKSKLSIVDIVSDSLAYEVDSEFILQAEPAPTLRSANFNIDLAEQNVLSTEYFNYNELFSYPVNNSNNQIYSVVNEKSIDISVDYSNYSDFVHFSSAQERLLNFKYKLDLINDYSQSIALTSLATTGLQGASGSKSYYENLLTGVVSNFDHYERFLYYESGSTSWPKSNTTKPYVNKLSNTSEAITWYSNQIANAIEYDNTNYSSLAYSIPTYLRDDANNENYLTFVFMIGQHFDNLWLYSKAVTDKYDADNRIDKGISKDLVAEALKNFGVKLYTSNKSVEDLFTTFIGQAYQSGSEKINYYITGSLTGSNTPIQPSSYDNYQKEVQKRIYHNLPLLLKSKGTERGLRALINCLGIPGNILDIKLYGGRNTNERPFYGDYQYYTSSLDKVRLDHTGSLISGSTLSNYVSIVKRNNKYTDDLHAIEVGFSPTDNVDKYIISKSLADPNLATFNIDQYIGNPSSLTLPDYEGLYKVAENILGDLTQYDVRDYVKLIKFFDNTVFKMVKDFVPARTVADTGIIIKPNLLNRSKAKSIKASVDTITGSNMDNAFTYTSSIDTAFAEGYHGDTFGSVVEYIASYKQIIDTPEGRRISYLKDKGEAKFDGELANSAIRVTTGELNRSNTLKKAIPPKVQFNVKFYLGTPPDLCTLDPGANDTFVVQPGIPYALGPLFGANSVSAPPNTLYYLGTNTQGTQIPSTYTFTGNQYDTTNIHGYAKVNCEETVNFRIVTCSLGPDTAPSYIVAGVSYDFANWFTLNLNTLVVYTVQKNNTPPETLGPGVSTYVFNGVTGDAYTVTVTDKYDTNCTRSVTKQFYTCLILPQQYTVFDLYAGPGGNTVIPVNFPDFFEGELPTSTYQYQAVTGGTKFAPNIDAWQPALPNPPLSAQDALGFDFIGNDKAGLWVKLINVKDDCERVIKLVKRGDGFALDYIGLSYGKTAPNGACTAGAIITENSSAYGNGFFIANSVYYIKIASEPSYSFQQLWNSGKQLRAFGTGDPINGWCSDGYIALPYTNGYPNPSALPYFNFTGTAIVCSTLHGYTSP